MNQRYEAYKDLVVRGFYKEYFSRFDKQIVLVDVLKTLNAGYGNFADTQESIGTILKSFHYGRSGFISRLFRPKIDKLLFAASKVDNIAPNQHNNLKLLLEKVIAECENNVVFEGVSTETITLSSLKTIQSVVCEYEDRKFSCVRAFQKARMKKWTCSRVKSRRRYPRPGSRAALISWNSGRPGLPTPKAGACPMSVWIALEFLIGDKLL